MEENYVKHEKYSNFFEDRSIIDGQFSKHLKHFDQFFFNFNELIFDQNFE